MIFAYDIEIDETKYTKKEGSTIITLLNSYLKTLSEGTHTLKVTYNNNEEVTTDFLINESAEAIANPKTGDNVLSLVLINIISLIGLLGSAIYLKTKKVLSK